MPVCLFLAERYIKDCKANFTPSYQCYLLGEMLIKCGR